MTKQIVYVLSTNYAGSHLLSLQLGSHSKVVSAGELLHRRRPGFGDLCHRCDSDEVCPVYAGLQGRPVSTFYRRIFENLAAYDEQIETVVDNSKKIRWARRSGRKANFTKKYIHLIRDPRALIRRWTMSFKTAASKKKIRLKTARHCPMHFLDVLRGDETNVYLWYWLFKNRRITNYIKSKRLDARVVTYHDLVASGPQVLSELTQWLGLDYEPGQEQYWNFQHHGTVKTSYMKPPSDERMTLDQRWKSFLDPETQDAVFNNPRIRSYIDQLGIEFDIENGLIGKPSDQASV